MATHQHDAASAVVQAAPSAVAVAAYAADITPERWLTYIGIVFIVLQAAYLLWKWRREAKGKR